MHAAAVGIETRGCSSRLVANFRSVGAPVSDPLSIAGAVAELVHRSEPNVPVTRVITMDGLISDSVSPRRFSSVFVAIFAGLALLQLAQSNAAIGEYAGKPAPEALFELHRDAFSEACSQSLRVNGQAHNNPVSHVRLAVGAPSVCAT